MKKYKIILLAIICIAVLLYCCISFASNKIPTIQLDNVKLTINGVEVNTIIYTIDGKNYMSTEDVAKIFNKHQFFDKYNNMVIISDKKIGGS